jgi:hypothetical protein
MADQRPMKAFVVVAPGGVHYLGLCSDEEDAWRVALGWPSAQEIEQHKAKGWYAAEATLNWKKP